MWSYWLVPCNGGFKSFCPLMKKGKRLMVASRWERLTEGVTGSCSYGQGHGQYIFNPIFCRWVGLLFTWGQSMVEGMKIIVISFKRSHVCTAILSFPSLGTSHHWPTPWLEMPEYVWASLGQSLVGSVLLSPGCWFTQGSVCAHQEFVSQSCVSSGALWWG